MADGVSKGDVIAFRLGAHHLIERLAEDDLLDAAGRCGIQNSPPGSALLALHARVRNLTQEHMADAVAEEKSLLQTWCMRGSPFYFPAADAPGFTTGVLRPTEEALRHFVPGVGQVLDRLDLTLTETVELTGAEIRDVLSGHRLAIKELGAEIAERIARKLPKRQHDIWEEEGPYAHDQPAGEGVVHFCIRILTLQRVVCFAPRAGTKHRSSSSTNGSAIRFPRSTPRSRAPNCSAVTYAAMGRRHAGASPRGRGSMRVTPTPGGVWSRKS